MGSSSQGQTTLGNNYQLQNANSNTSGTTANTASGVTTQAFRPWELAQPQLTGLLNNITPALGNTGLTGTESNAIAGLTANAASNPYAPGIGRLANDLLTGGQDRSGYATNAYAGLNKSLSPYTTMDTNPYSNPAFVNATNTLSNDITDRIKSQYAGAGYSPVTSGDFGYNLGRGISAGVAPTWLQASNDLENRKLGAIGSLYGAGNTTANTLSGLDQTMLGNRVQGIDAANSALTANNQPYMAALQAEALRRGIPVENLAGLSNLIVPLAKLGGTTAGETSGQTTGQTSGQTAGTMYTQGFNNQFGNATKTPGLLDWMSGGQSSGAVGLGNLANAGLGLLGFLSDRNEKTDIKKVGEHESGLPLYSYRYKDDPKTYPKIVGPMAQDVEKLMPGSTVRIGGKLAIKPEAFGILGL